MPGSVRAILLTTAGLAAAAALAATVGAAGTPVSPSAGTTVATSHPVFRWRLPSTEVPESISISSSPALGTTGDFASFVQADILQADAKSWTPSKALSAGKYWWHVASHDTKLATGHLFSPATPFTIRTQLSLQSIDIKTLGSQMLVTVKLKANVRNVNVSETVFKGTKKIATRTTEAGSFLIDTTTSSIWVSGLPGVKHGTTLRLVVTLTVKGSTAKVTKGKTFKV
jgi:hypothetical protein